MCGGHRVGARGPLAPRPVRSASAGGPTTPAAPSWLPHAQWLLHAQEGVRSAGVARSRSRSGHVAVTAPCLFNGVSNSRRFLYGRCSLGRVSRHVLCAADCPIHVRHQASGWVGMRAARPSSKLRFRLPGLRLPTAPSRVRGLGIRPRPRLRHGPPGMRLRAQG
jgi:hypothetical protein